MCRLPGRRRPRGHWRLLSTAPRRPGTQTDGGGVARACPTRSRAPSQASAAASISLHRRARRSSASSSWPQTSIWKSSSTWAAAQASPSEAAMGDGERQQDRAGEGGHGAERGQASGSSMASTAARTAPSAAAGCSAYITPSPGRSARPSASRAQASTGSHSSRLARDQPLGLAGAVAEQVGRRRSAPSPRPRRPCARATPSIAELTRRVSGMRGGVDHLALGLPLGGERLGGRAGRQRERRLARACAPAGRRARARRRRPRSRTPASL